MIEPSLFDAPAAPAVRVSDLSTSHGAARSLTGPVLRREQARVVIGLAEIDRCGGDGATPHELAMRLAYGRSPSAPENCLASRLSELDRAGLVHRAGDTRPGGSGRQQRVARLTEAGRAAVADEAHSYEDSMKSAVLLAIASRATVEDPADLAALALTSRDIEFSRWYA